MTQYVIGVDGGGTKTHYALFDAAGNLLSFVQGGPANHEMYREGYEGTHKELRQSLQMLSRDSGINIGQINYAFFGLAGMDVKQQKDMLGRFIGEIGFRKFDIMNDAFLGIKAAGIHGCGVCSINGTGTCCAGIDPQGQAIQIGGTGYFFGDEGGSGHLGGMAFRKVYDYLFRAGQPTLMKELLFAMLDIGKDEDLVEAVYRQHYDDNWVQFSKIPFEAANQGDPAALELLAHSGREAAKSVIGAIRRLDFSTVEEIDVIMAGSVYVKGENPALIEAFQQEVRLNIPQKVRFTVLQVPPVAGAVLWALEALEKGLEMKVREKVIQSLSGLGNALINN